MTKCDWFPWTHIDAPEVNLALFGHDILNQVKFTNRNATRGDDEITLHGFCKFLTQAFHCITRNSKALWFCSCLSYRCFKKIAIAVAYLPWLQWFMDVDYFVACSQCCYARTAYHRYVCPAQGC